jgi:hypothetical protein
MPEGQFERVTTKVQNTEVSAKLHSIDAQDHQRNNFFSNRNNRRQ